MEIKSLKDTTSDNLYKAFQNAFADYEMQLSQDQLEAMLKRRGFKRELSFGAFDGEKLVSFTFNGIGIFNGVKTAYDTGTGTTSEYRGKGLAQKIFNHSIRFLKEDGIEQYLLEVLQHNEGAVHLYKKMGFEVVREFEYFVFAQNDLKMKTTTNNSQYSIQENIRLSEIDSTHFWDFYPSWQNSFDSISRQAEAFRSLGIYADKQLIAYCIFEPENGDITQFAVHKKHRNKGVGIMLFKEMQIKMYKQELKIINTDLTCKSVQGFLNGLGLKRTGKQFEMVMYF